VLRVGNKGVHPPGESERRQIVRGPTLHLSNHVRTLVAAEDRHAASLFRDDVPGALSPRLVVGQSREGESGKHNLIVRRTLTRAMTLPDSAHADGFRFLESKNWPSNRRKSGCFAALGGDMIEANKRRTTKMANRPDHSPDVPLTAKELAELRH